MLNHLIFLFSSTKYIREYVLVWDTSFRLRGGDKILIEKKKHSRSDTFILFTKHYHA